MKASMLKEILRLNKSSQIWKPQKPKKFSRQKRKWWNWKKNYNKKNNYFWGKL